MIEYYFNFFVIVVFGGYLANCLGFFNIRFLILVVLLIIILIMHDYLTLSDEDEDGEQNKK